MSRTSTKVCVLEVMGRHAGWATAACALAAEREEGQCSSRLARYGSNPFQTWKPVFGGSRKHFCCFTRTFSRRTITANSVFASLADIMDACETAWNRFATNHRLIRSLCAVAWAPASPAL